MKKIILFSFVLLSLFSCKQEESEDKTLYQVPKAKEEHFGFDFNDFNVIHDTIKKGDTFGYILDNQNIGGYRVYDIVNKIKDTFDVRTVRVGKSYVFLRSKDRYKKLQYMVYQPDRGSYYVIDFRDKNVFNHASFASANSHNSTQVSAPHIAPRIVITRISSSKCRLL